MLTIRPIDLRDANRYVFENHRHNMPTNGHKFSIAVYDDDRLCGVAICGKPVARLLDDGMTIEIRRVCTDGTRNACSKLYGACVRIARDLGYKKAVTYTLESEPGTSLKASNFQQCGKTGGDTWSREARKREVVQMTLFGESIKYSTEPKIRWEKEL